MTDFVPFKPPRGAFTGVGAVDGRSPGVQEVVVPFRSAAAQEVRALPGFGRPAGASGPTRTIFPREEAPVREPPPPPPGPTADEIAAMVKDAEARGLQRGRKEAEAELAARVEQERRFGALADGLDRDRAAVVGEARAEIGGVVVSSLRRLVGEVPELLELLVEARCREAVEQLHSAREVVLRCNPRDEPAARRIIGDRAGWRVVADPSISGGSVTRSEGGELDATLETAFTGLDAALAAWRAERGDD